MEILDEFDIKIIKELEKDGRMAYSAIATHLKISNTMVHQRINRLTEQGILTGIKPVINEKKVGYDWGAFTGLTLNKDQDSTRIIEELKKIYGLDKPLYIQFFSWVYSILQLDFGISFTSGEKVKEEILSRIPITLTINIVSMILIFIISLYFGIKSAMKKNSIFDRFTNQLSLLSFSMPSFYLALVLVLVFSIKFELFPIAGLHSVPNDGSLNYYLDFAWHLTLPIFIIVFGGIGSLILYIRALTIEILKSDYIFFARARGLDNKKILRYYILPNLYPPVITLLGLSLPGVIGGSVILETIFSIDGMFKKN